MGYRDVSESLRGYRDRIAKDLEEARRAAKDAAAQAAKVSVLERELTETDGLLDQMSGKRRGLPMLDQLQIAAPCTASWDDMVGDEHVRFCGQCDKNVYDLSSLPREEAEALLLAREGSMCVRMYRRADGTVLTADCPVGVKKRRRRRTVVAAVGGGLMAAAAALGLEGTSRAPLQSAQSASEGAHATAPCMGTPVAPPIATSMGSVAAPADTTPPARPQDKPRGAGQATTGHVMGRR